MSQFKIIKNFIPEKRRKLHFNYGSWQTDLHEISSDVLRVKE